MNMEKTNEHSAKVIGRDLSISTKHTIELANALRGKKLQKSKQFLQRVLQKKQVVPFTRFNRDMGHKPGPVAAGRYPQKATMVLASLLNAVEANAQNKGLDTENLIIKLIIANKASRPFRTGRTRRIKAKRTHVEIVVEEEEQEGKKVRGA
jgi:ribosomal protein uL22